MSQPRKNPKKSRNICTWIRERISSYDYGVKTQKGNPAHVNKNDDILYHFQVLKMGWHGRRLCRLKNKDMADHFAGKKTYYFTAIGRSRTAEVLINIDIDCHNSGSLEGAIAFGEHLRATKFPNLYFEKSTNGKGVHGYIVVLKGDLGDEGLNGALTVLDRWLKAELTRGNWNVENVEAKGHCPEFTWGREKYELRTYKSGQLAKLPREALVRADELRGTTRVAVDDLRRLFIPVGKVESEDSVVPANKKSAKKPSVVSVSGNDNRQEETVVVSPSVKKQALGSIACRHFDEEDLSKLKDGYLSLASELLGGEVLVASGRKVVKEEDLAVFLMLVKFFSDNMNIDGTLPTARWREMWKALFEAGDIERAWCHHRFKALRNFLSGKDLLSWKDEDFVAGVLDDQGQFVPGKSAKWCASEELMSMIEQVDGQHVVSTAQGRDFETNSAEKLAVPAFSEVGVVHEEGREEERGILHGYNHQVRVQPEEEEERRSTLYGYTAYEIPNLTPESRQSTKFLEDLQHLGIVMPLQRPRFVGYSTGQYRKAA